MQTIHCALSGVAAYEKQEDTATSAIKVYGKRGTRILAATSGSSLYHWLILLVLEITLVHAYLSYNTVLYFTEKLQLFVCK